MFYLDWYVLLFVVGAPLGFLIAAVVVSRKHDPGRNRTFNTIMPCCMSVVALVAMLMVSSATSGSSIKSEIADQVASQLAVDRDDLRYGEGHPRRGLGREAPRRTALPSTVQFEVRGQTLRVWH